MSLPIEQIDGNPAEVALESCVRLQLAISDAEKFCRNAAMSEILEVNPDATSEELIDAWDASAERAYLSQAKVAALTLSQYVRNYEGYVE